MVYRYARLGAIILIFILLLISIYSPFSFSITTKQSQKEIKIGVDDTIPPFSYINKDGKLEGFNIDLLLAMEKYTNFTFKFIPGTWSEIMNLFYMGEIDAIMFIVPTPQRNKTFLFTEPYQQLYFDFFQRANMPPINNIGEIANHTIAVVKNDITEIFAKDWMNKTHEKLYLVEVNTPAEGLKLLNSNSVDLFLYEIHTTSYLISKLNLKNVRLTNVKAFSIPITIGVRKSMPWVVEVLNHAIDEVRNSGEYTTLYNKWFNPKTSSNMPWYFYFTAITLIVSIGVIIYMGSRYVIAEKRVRAQHKKIKNLMILSQTLMENMPIGLLYVKKDRCIYANPQSLKILGYNFQEINQNKIFRELMINGEIKIKTKQGDEKWLLTKSISYGGGKIISLIDITEKKNARTKRTGEVRISK